MTDYWLAINFVQDGFEDGLGMLDVSIDRPGLDVVIDKLVELRDSDLSHVHISPTGFLGDDRDEQAGYVTVRVEGDSSGT